MPEQMTIIRPIRSFWQIDLAEIYRYRDLLFFFTLRDLKVRYRQTVIGIAWAILQPLLQMLIFTLFFGKFIRVSSEGFPYPIFVLAGLVPWNFFANSLNACNYAIINHAGLIRKVYFPRLIIPLSAIFTNLVDFCLSFLVLFALMLFYNLNLSPNLLYLIPLIILLFLTTFGVGTLLSALSVRYRDVRHVIPFIIQLWLFVTPVIYPSSLLPSKYRFLLNLNPVAGTISAIRALILNQPMDFRALCQAFILTVILLILGIFYYNHQARQFADYI